jgi:NAD(P)-dependent dehydrogenase (short-subunit alcohol dehydrogenase family)
MSPATEGFSLAGRRAIVTGAASGVGQATAGLLAALGAEVVGLDIVPFERPDVAFLYCDLGDPASVDAAATAVGGPIDALCNIAAVPSGAPVSRERIVAINYLGPRRLTEALLPRMGAGSAIVCVSSGAGMDYARRLDVLRPFVALGGDVEAATRWLRDHPDLNTGYPFSKEATNLWVKLHAGPYAETRRIRLNAVAPGLVDTQQLRTSTSGSRDELIAAFKGPLGRVSQPIEQAWAIAFLASPAASYVNGQILQVDGGLSTTAFHADPS